MKTTSQRKAAAKAELKRRNYDKRIEPSTGSYVRISSYLMQTFQRYLDLGKHRISTRRKYLMAYDKKELRSYINALHLHIGRGARFGEGYFVNCNTTFKPFNFILSY